MRSRISSSPGEPLGKRNIGVALGGWGQVRKGSQGMGLGWAGVKLSKKKGISSVQVRNLEVRARACFPKPASLRSRGHLLKG